MPKELNTTDFQDNAELCKSQMKQLWALFSQIQHNLKHNKNSSATLPLAELGNYLTDMWGYEHGEILDQLLIQNGVTNHDK